MSKRAVVALFVAIGVLGIVAFALSGLHLFDILTPSMGRTAPVGSLVVERSRLVHHVGDIVTFAVDGRFYTHRVVSLAHGLLTTKGDLNGVPDGWRIPGRAVIGTVVWICPGLGFLMRAAPWLLLGGVLVESIARFARVRRSHIASPWHDTRFPRQVRLVGYPVVIALVSLWLRPWLNAQLLDFRSVDHGPGILMHVVNTGLFPLRALGRVLVPGQDAVVRVTEQLPDGKYVLNPLPALTWWQYLLVIVVCLLPVLIGGGLREPGASATRPRSRAGTRRPLWAVEGIMVLTAVCVVGMVVGTSHSAFAAKISNATTLAGTNSFFTCLAAETNPGAANVFAAYPLGTAWGTSATDVSGNVRTGTFLKTATTTSSHGCNRDTPLASTTFDGTAQCVQVPGYVTAGPTVFSLEAWFSTSKVANGKIIGYGTATGSPYDGNYDRQIYLNASGQLVFTVWTTTWQSIVTPAGRSYADGSWHHVVATLSAGGMALYVDGGLAATDPATTTAWTYGGYWKVGCGSLVLVPGVAGTADVSYTGPYYFTGQLQFAAIYNIALNAAQVKAHYLAGP